MDSKVGIRCLHTPQAGRPLPWSNKSHKHQVAIGSSASCRNDLLQLCQRNTHFVCFSQARGEWAAAGFGSWGLFEKIALLAIEQVASQVQVHLVVDATPRGRPGLDVALREASLRPGALKHAEPLPGFVASAQPAQMAEVQTTLQGVAT